MRLSAGRTPDAPSVLPAGSGERILKYRGKAVIDWRERCRAPRVREGGGA